MSDLSGWEVGIVLFYKVSKWWVLRRRKLFEYYSMPLLSLVSSGNIRVFEFMCLLGGGLKVRSTTEG